MRIGIGQLPGQASISASNAAAAFSDPGDLMNYCAANPTAEAGYAPSGQMNPQVLPCEEWPSLFPGYAVSTVAVSSSSASTSWWTDSSIDSIPNWVLVLGIVALGWWYFKKQGRAF